MIINISTLQCGYSAPNRLENSHTQALAPNGALSLSLRDSPGKQACWGCPHHS